MKILVVRFQRPRRSRTSEPDVLWEFTAETDENLPHGHPCYAGRLRKKALGWQAQGYGDGDKWSPFGFDRLEAMVNHLPNQIASLQKYTDDQKALALAVDVRRNLVSSLQRDLPLNVVLQMENLEEVHETPVYQIKIKNLSGSQARSLKIAIQVFLNSEASSAQE